MRRENLRGENFLRKIRQIRKILSGWKEGQTEWRQLTLFIGTRFQQSTKAAFHHAVHLPRLRDPGPYSYFRLFECRNANKTAKSPDYFASGPSELGLCVCLVTNQRAAYRKEIDWAVSSLNEAVAKSLRNPSQQLYLKLIVILFATDSASK